MGYKRGRLEFEMKGIDYVLEISTLIFLATVLIYTFVNWKAMPPVIPSHFTLNGEIDGYGSKNFIAVFSCISVGLYLLLTFITKIPNQFNFAVKITEENERIQYRMAILMLRVLKLEIAALFGYIQIVQIDVALGGTRGMGMLFMPVFLVLIFGTVGVYIFFSVKYK
ncbi:MAG: DUF1648 domain-containing protein [Clostridiales bacterium]|nr:DUF1648 domain-containing protein [Clostridiales bacterium]